ncbi:DUF4164 family protein [Methylosinus sp. Ce-a6]|uniref:DUF4164 family protein n=1 Tax=Methylosinus sp. Ce-a6 TaxID=2172005 RepID=UPI00135CA57B|nr:DUF4164 family protein [Methylosinus sp. Ce-a6]
MTQVSNRLDDALQRLSVALERLEETVTRRIEAELSHADLEEELAVMQDDRSRLGLELDAALAQNSALEKARDEVLTRLDRTSLGIRAVLGDDDRTQSS